MQTQTQVKILDWFAHVNGVTCLKNLKDGRLASGGQDNLVKVWNIFTGEPIAILEKHEQAVTALEYLSNGVLVSGSFDSTILFWDITKKTSMMPLQSSHIGGVFCLKELANGNLASGGGDGYIKIWNPNSFELLKNIQENSNLDNVNFLITLRNGLLASASMHNNVVKMLENINHISKVLYYLKIVFSFILFIKRWNPDTGVEVINNNIKDIGSSIRGLMQLSDHDLAICGDNSNVYNWNTKNSVFKILSRVPATCNAFIFDETEDILVLATDSKQLIVLDVSEIPGKHLKSLSITDTPTCLEMQYG